MTRQPFRLGVVATAVLAAVLVPDSPALADPTLDVTVTGAGLASGGLGVVLTGRYVCGPFSPDSDGVVDLTVTQDVGSTTTTGYGYLYPTVCDGTARSWSASVDGVGGQFVRGRAQVSGSGYVCDRAPGGACAHGSFGPTGVRIR